MWQSKRTKFTIFSIKNHCWEKRTYVLYLRERFLGSLNNPIGDLYAISTRCYFLVSHGDRHHKVANKRRILPHFQYQPLTLIDIYHKQTNWIWLKWICFCSIFETQHKQLTSLGSPEARPTQNNQYQQKAPPHPVRVQVSTRTHSGQAFHRVWAGCRETYRTKTSLVVSSVNIAVYRDRVERLGA